MSSDLDKRRARLGEALRQLRERAGFLSGKAFAELHGWQQSKVSRIETGFQLPTDGDLASWFDTTEPVEAVAARLRDELFEIRIGLASWKRQLRTGNRPRQEHALDVESAASRIRAFEISVVPGLVQTAEYAAHVFATNAEFYGTPADVADSVRARMERQAVLYDSSKQIDLVFTEAALRYPVCPPEVLAAQVDRLLAVLGLPAVRIGIIPLDTRLPVVAMHGFWIIDDQVLIETVDTEITLADPEEVALYHRMADAMWTVAAAGDAARAILVRIAAALADR